MNDLATASSLRDGTYGGVMVQFGDGAFSQDDVTATSTSITIPIHASVRSTSRSISGSGPLAMTGGNLGIDFELNTTLTFNVDSAAITSAATAPPTALSLVPPTISLCARATAAVAKFTARFGFTDVNVSTDNPATTGTTEASKLHACASVPFADPDSVGGITMDEWASARAD